MSIVSVCAMVLLALWGLARPIGRAGAAVVAAAIGGSQLLLLYGRIAIVEPFAALLLVAAFVTMMRALGGRHWWLSVASGVLLTLAVTSKASAALALPGIVGVPLVGSLIERNWYRLRVAAMSIGAFVAALVTWGVAVALPNSNRLRAGLNTLYGTSGNDYPHNVTDLWWALWRWLSHPVFADHVTVWTRPQLIACIAGLGCCAVFWKRCTAMQRYVAASGAVWALVSWLVFAGGAYHPNRYFVVAVPGLALAAGPGLGVAAGWLATRARRPRWTVAIGSVMGALVATPGVIGSLAMETPVQGTDQLAEAQRTIAAALPKNAVVFGTWGTEVAFSDHVRLVVPWAPTKLHMDAPIARYGVEYVIVDVGPASNPTDRAFLKAVSAPGYTLGQPLATVHWGPHRLALYHIVRAARLGHRRGAHLQ